MQDPKEAQLVKTTQLIFFALLAGVVMFLGITLFLHADKLVFDPSDIHVFMYVLLGLIVMELPLLFILPKPMYAAARKAETFDKQWTQYQTACLVRWALLEGICLFAVVCLFITQNLVFLIPFAVVFAGLLALHPSRQKFDDAIGGHGSDFVKKY